MNIKYDKIERTALYLLSIMAFNTMTGFVEKYGAGSDEYIQAILGINLGIQIACIIGLSVMFGIWISRTGGKSK